MDWPSTLPPCPILRGVIDRVAAAGADHVERMWGEMSTYTAKCDICGTENVVPNYGDWACRQCLQGYIYDECHRIVLADAQLALLRNPPKWIPVSERMPAKGERVLFFVDRKTTGLRAAYVGEYVSHSAFRSWACYEDERGWDASFVTHWMPLPEPPPTV